MKKIKFTYASGETNETPLISYCRPGDDLIKVEITEEPEKNLVLVECYDNKGKRYFQKIVDIDKGFVLRDLFDYDRWSRILIQKL
jgi:hypothetical protein